MTRRVLILGGTGEARRLAGELAGRAELEVVSSLAGRVRSPALPAGTVRVGGFGGAEGLREYLRAERVALVVDATHPFAATISASAVAATDQLELPLLVLRRPGWTAQPGDRWHWVPTLAAAAEHLSGLGERVFLSTGRGGLGEFAQLTTHWFLIRSVDPPAPPLPARRLVLLDRGPFAVADELRLFTEHRIDVLVTKDSGGSMTSAKLAAARELGVPVLIQRRPPAPDRPTAATVPAAVRWIDTWLGRP